MSGTGRQRKPTRIRVLGEVVGKQRVRATAVNGRVRTYPEKKGASFENMVRMEYQHQGGTFYDCPVVVTVAYRRPMPASRPKKTLWEWDDKKPDVDNVVKAVLDALNGVAYEDDKSAVIAEVMKLPRVRGVAEEIRIEVREATEEDIERMNGTWQRFTS